MSPGMTARPSRSIVRVSSPASEMIASDVPTAEMNSPLSATASAMEKRSSTVMILPFVRIMSGGRGCEWETLETSASASEAPVARSVLYWAAIAPGGGLPAPSPARRPILQIELDPLDAGDRAHDGTQALLNRADARRRASASALLAHDRAGDGHDSVAGHDRE